MEIKKEMRNAHDLVIVSMEYWDDIWRRSQFIADGIATTSPHSKVLFVELSRHILKSRLLSPMNRVSRPFGAFDNLHVFKPVHLFSWDSEKGGKINEISLCKQICRTVRHLGMHHPVLWINLHDAWKLPTICSNSGVIYDITDDWTANDQPATKRDRVMQMDRTLCETADLVVVCSRKLLNDKASACQRIALIPNGVEVDKYRDVSSETPNPRWKKGELPRPILGYTGTLHKDRLDVSLLCDIAERNPTASVVLLGPCYLGADHLRKLKSYPNIHIFPPVAYAHIPIIMRDIDCYIVPHLVNDFTESLNPLKLWECLACGKPVVSTHVAGFSDYPELVYLANTADEFANQIQVALNEASCMRNLRIDVAEQNSWVSRVQHIQNLIESVVRERNAENVRT